MAIEDVLKDMQRQISDLKYVIDGLRNIEKPVIQYPQVRSQIQDTIISYGSTSGQYYMLTGSSGWSSGAPKGLFLLVFRYYQATFAPGRVLFRYTNNGSSWNNITTPRENATHSMTVNDGERILVQYHNNVDQDYLAFAPFLQGEGTNITFGNAAGDGRWSRRWFALFVGNNY